MAFTSGTEVLMQKKQLFKKLLFSDEEIQSSNIYNSGA
jgi:hypothetical protein